MVVGVFVDIPGAKIDVRPEDARNLARLFIRQFRQPKLCLLRLVLDRLIFGRIGLISRIGRQLISLAVLVGHRRIAGDLVFQ